ncbi:GGDEF domain-containing protein [Janthinobacterium fluminis]|uniref:diguanylate cyclase n=1 Tax=Janthinobacterium fluminis TaxID=2987524 RepID=A0ABT5KAQ0_9BURK|nr:GGDEF domain-containing protein [Janthinobacterium fluminis]MDC8760902.1 GGDEF domain-containing protein [Janthinobacterium fluminis]
MAELRPKNVAMFVHPDGERRAEFQRECGELFERLYLCADTGEAAPELVRRRIDLLVLDVWQLEREVDLAGVGELLRSRAGAPTLLLCPFTGSAWIPELMAYGPLQYLITPACASELQQCVRQALHQIDHAPGPELLQFQLQAKEKELRELLAIQRGLQRVLADADDPDRVAEQVCLALCAFPGVRHSALFQIKARGDLQLLAQESRNHLDLRRLLQRDDRLFQSPLRDVFPPLLAAAGGALVLLDAPEKSGHPELAVSLYDRDVQMVLGVPLGGGEAGAIQGALGLMFDRRMPFSREQFNCFASLAQLIGFGLAMGELKRRNDELRGQLDNANTTDALTGTANRRQGEYWLGREIGRARRYGVPLALLSVGVDRFAELGERHGAGAALALKTLAAAAQATLRGSDELVRMGEDSFLIIAPHTTAIDAVRIGEKVRAAVMAADFAGCERVSISVGVAELGGEESAEGLLRRLGAALCLAQRGGGNCIEQALALV